MILYLDTSSLVKLYVLEPSEARDGKETGWESEEVRHLCAQADDIYISVIGYAEARSALARRRGEHQFSNPEGYDRAIQDLDHNWRALLLKVDLTERLVHFAGGLAEKHGLRAYDAVHLATGIMLQMRFGEINFSSWDQELLGAAPSEGLVLAH